jgi:hypothetical protein
MLMLRLSLFFLMLCLVIGDITAQGIPSYWHDIEPIVRQNCSPCHRRGGIGPFSLVTFEEVKSKASMVSHVTKTRYMPPWKADPTFRTFKNEKRLTDFEIDLIERWIDAGMPQGMNLGKTFDISVVQDQKEVDLTLTMEHSYRLSPNSKEDFRFFVVPTNIISDTYLSAIEFVPGNKRQVHHSRIMVDSTQLIRGINGRSEFDPSIKVFQRIPLADEFLYGWVPGNEKIFFPPGTGKRLAKGSDLILNIHYSPSPKLQEDQSKVNLYFAKDPVKREVRTLALRENDIVNQPFFIKSGEKPLFVMDYLVQKDISLISVMPHMHFIGKSFLAYVVTLKGETIPLIKIDNWDFNWQTTYQFKRLIKIPVGSRIIVKAEYDNTNENFANPNHPPKDIGYGWNSTDEMCNMVIYYLDYEKNDELIDY